MPDSQWGIGVFSKALGYKAPRELWTLSAWEDQKDHQAIASPMVAEVSGAQDRK